MKNLKRNRNFPNSEPRSSLRVRNPFDIAVVRAERFAMGRTRYLRLDTAAIYSARCGMYCVYYFTEYSASDRDE